MNDFTRFRAIESDCISEILWQDGEHIYGRTSRSGADGAQRDCFAAICMRDRTEPEHAARLVHAYGLRDYLDSAWALRPLELVRERGRTMLLLDSPQGEPLERLIGPTMEMERFLRVAIALSVALGRLHERGLVHKDIKPINVLVDAAADQAWLTGFGIASSFPREHQSPEAPEMIAGTLPYMAPEQTGRMNRSIDSRSDLYSAGVTLYQTLTGTLPFEASDPMEWVHCHMARKPLAPNERFKDIPAPVSAIIMKLLAKTPEERYQTAAGVESDLRRCLRNWVTYGHIDPFELGNNDAPGRLIMSEKLFGRAAEVNTLIEAFDRVVAHGKVECVLVTGHAGIGKSALVNKLLKVLAPPRGLVATGKFDQYKRNIPYSTLGQAFEMLIRQILIKSDVEVLRWRSALAEALGPNGQLIVNLVPEVELIIGVQPAVQELAPEDAKNRFRLVFKRFVGVFARLELPLTLFLDDLQWEDAATLEMIEYLLAEPDVRHLLLIAAYRDNEVYPTHQLTRTLNVIRQSCQSVHEIALAPLGFRDISSLIAETLRIDALTAAPLAELLREKAGGNPFFTTQLIATLAEEQLLVFGPSTSAWSWDLDRIRAKGYTDNVAVLMSARLHRLPIRTLEALRNFACLGHSVEIATLAMICGETESTIDTILTEAVEAGLVTLCERTCSFVHDRIQEAAYALIPEHERCEIHVKIGRILAAHTTPQPIETDIFEIVSHYNRGTAMIRSTAEREQVAALNLAAGKRAKESTAYDSARMYLAAGRALLSADSWERCYELMFRLELHGAECEFLTGDRAVAEERLLMLSRRAQGLIDPAEVTCLQVMVYFALDRSDRAIDVCLAYLRGVGVHWSAHPTRQDVQQEYDRVWERLADRPIDDLVNLPAMTDENWQATIRVLTIVQTAAQYFDENLHSLIICRMVNLSLEHGNCDASCYAYVMFAMLLGPRFGTYQTGFHFGSLALNLVEKDGFGRFKARVLMCFGALVSPWTQHLRIGRTLIQRAFTAAQDSGDLNFTVYSSGHLAGNLLACGEPLAEVRQQAERSLDIARRARNSPAEDNYAAQLRLIMSLRGLLPHFGSFNDPTFDEARFEHHLESNPNGSIATCIYWIRKMQARFYADDFAAAIEASAKAERFLWTGSFSYLFDWHLYAALSLAAQHTCDTIEGRLAQLRTLLSHQEKLALWARNCPENFGCRAALIAAEVSRLDARPLEAERLYEDAIRLALEHGFVQVEAIAREAAARFYAARGLETIANAYLQSARACYLRWGADGKVRQIDLKHPHLAPPMMARRPAGTIGASVEQLDLTTIVKVSQAVAGEIDFNRLIDTLMKMALEHAGGERGLLILPQGEDMWIEADATCAADAVVVSRPHARVSAAKLPESVYHFVMRTRDSIVLDDASRQDPFLADEYIRRNNSRSILCLPLIKQAQLIGVLYIENSLTSHVFTPARLAVLRLLASQAATSLENARLYSELRDAGVFLAQAQRLSRTGSFGWSPSGEAYWSDECFRIFEYDRTTKPSLDLIIDQRIHPEDVGSFRQDIERALREGKDYAHEYRLQMPDGRVKYLNVVAHATQRATGGVDFFGAVMEVTEQRRAQVERERLEQRLRQAEKMEAVGRLASGIAHDFNGVLANVFTYGEMVFDKVPVNSPLKRHAQGVLTAATIGRDLVGQILDYSGARRGKLEPVNVVGVVTESLELVRNSLPADISLRWNAPKSPLVVIGDATRLHRVLANLCTNAIHAMTGGGTLNVALEVAEFSSQQALSHGSIAPGRYLRVVVADTGSGMDEATLSRIFEPFFTTKEVGQGTGLGLALVYAIITEAAGAIDVKSVPGQGSIFAVYIAHPDLRIGGETEVD